MMEEEDVSGSFFDSSHHDAASVSSMISVDTPSLATSIYSSHYDVNDPWSTNGTVVDVMPAPVDLASSAMVASVLMEPESVHPVNVGSLLAGVALPDIYDTAFKHAGPSGGKISLASLNRVLSLGGLPPLVVKKILHLVIPSNSSHLTRNEFYVALALVGLAQKNMDVSLENVAARTDDLPIPALPGIEALLVKHVTTTITASSNPPVHRNSVDDPWRSSQSTIPAANGYATQTVVNTNTIISTITTSAPASYITAPASYITDPSFSIPTSPPSGPLILPPSLSNPGGGRQEEYQWYLDMDLIRVTVAPEREGFLFKHVNYIVESQQRASTATRRYSDFWWLLETLGKRYPFRILPNLPPKKLGGIDDAFLEKRRKGLTRFINFVARHPILREDAVVVTFLTEPTEFLTWRRQSPPSMEEEFARKKPILEEFEAQIPSDLDERLEKVRKRLSPSIEYYTTMCFVMERLVRRYEGQATDYNRYSSALDSLADTEKQCHLEDCYNCPQVVRGYQQVSNYMQRAGKILEAQANADTNGVLENLKRHRDLLVSFKELFDRKDRLSVNTIENVQKRIAGNQIKLAAAREQPGMETEADRLAKAVENDKKDIEFQKHRGIHIRFSLHQEVSLFHKQTAFVSILYQGYVNSQIKFAQQTTENWKALSGPVYDMPVETSGFG